MKKLLLLGAALTALFGGSALAADLRRPAYTPPAPPPVYNWTGLYWDGNIGYSWGEVKRDFTVPARGAGAVRCGHNSRPGFRSYGDQFWRTR
jgi:outer membrane immunogenic protein